MEQLLIKNFKAIVNQKAVPIKIKRMTVLMGEQASGKSTIGKLVYFFKTIREEITLFFTSDFLVVESNFKLVIQGQIHSRFTKLFGSSRRLTSFEITYTYANGEVIAIRNSEAGSLEIDFAHWLPKLQKVVALNKELKRLENAFSELERKEREIY